jgi:protein kinase C substrate 80K-H
MASLDLGAHGEFRALSQKCFKFDAADYTYEFCPFDHVSQKRGAVELAGLGTWQADSWTDDAHRTMHYKHGVKCWNGPERSTRVTLECGARAEITSVSEPEMCSYLITFVTPAACSAEDLARLESSISQLKMAPSKDEL